MFDSRDPSFERIYLERYEQARRLSRALEGPSLAERFAALPKLERDRILAELSPSERATLLYTWRFWSRPKQVVPDVPHRIMLWLGGRGMGKNRAAAERMREKIYAGAKTLLVVGATKNELLRYQVGGKKGKAGTGSALLDVFPPSERDHIHVKEQKMEIDFEQFGATCYLVSDEQPELRGGGFAAAWLDEICKWRHLTKLWNNLEFSMREPGELPVEILVTTTPKAMRFLKELVADPDTVTVMGSTDENRANLDAKFVARLERKFGQSRIARQERGGEILSDNEGAQFHAHINEATRVTEAPALKRIVVPIDPAIATNPDNDETGILAMGLGYDDHVYVFADMSDRHSPEQWGTAAVKLYDTHKADAFVGERNRGGDLVAANIRATLRERHGSAAVAKIVEVHATRGKAIRVEPVSVLHEQGRLHIVGVLPKLEQEMTEWDPRLGGVSPNRLDALVWGCFELLGLENDEPEVDNAAGFIGIVDAAAQLTQAPAAPGAPSVLADVLRPQGWGGGL